MTAESLENVRLPLSRQGQRALGELMISPDTIPDEPKLLRTLPPQAEDLSVRSLALVTTLIKETFQAIPSSYNADQRDTARAHLREESVRKIFKTVGILQTTSEANEAFGLLYRQTEDSMKDVDRDRLGDLLDEFEGHPALRALDMLQKTAPIPDDVVFMRRACLVMLSDHTQTQSD
jgi:hypothetical protein